MKIKGTGAVTSADFKEVKWVGTTKGGSACTIKITDAMNMGNIEWQYAEKNDVVPNIEFTSCYDNTDEASTSTEETWSVEVDGTLTGAAQILLGAGRLYVDNNLIALSRGGGQFTVEREFRNINADGDRGPVKGRVVCEGATAKLSMNVLTMLGNVQNLYSCIEVSA